jgi:pimeloyl-ACP methyl ester carboxylesterase
MPHENGQRVEINGHHLFVQTCGREAGPAVILLHHGLGATPSWKAQIPVLEQAGFRVIAYDRWGYGRSDSRERFSIPNFEEDLADLDVLLEIFEARPASLVGHSDGGTISLYYAAQSPGRVSRLVTIAAHIYVDQKMPIGIEEIRQAFEANQGFQRGLERIHPGKARQVFYNWYNGWSKKELTTWDMRERLAEVVCPGMVVQGWEDEHALPEHAFQLALGLHHAELWLLSGVGHMLPQDAPTVFNPRLVQFLSSGPTARV